MPNPAVGTVSTEYVDHLRFNEAGATSVRPGATVRPDFMENLLGHRSGIAASSPWMTPIVTGVAANPYEDVGTSTTAPTGTTYTFDGKSYTANLWQNRWVVAQLAGGGLTIGQIASNTGASPPVATLTAAGWSNGTPPAGLYRIVPSLSVSLVLRDNWLAGVLRKDGNTESM